MQALSTYGPNNPRRFAGNAMLKSPPKTTLVGGGERSAQATNKTVSSLAKAMSSSSSSSAARACQTALSPMGGRYALRTYVQPTCRPVM